MKFAILKSLTLGFALLAASSAFASTKNNLQISDAVLVNGTTLKPGSYKVEWEGSGSNIELSILQGKKVVAKVPAYLVELNDPASYDAAVTQKSADGTTSLIGMRFKGKKADLKLGESSDGMQAGSSK
jgi:hypothetical protein